LCVTKNLVKESCLKKKLQINWLNGLNNIQMPKHLLRNNQQSRSNRRGGLPIQYIIQTQNFSKLEKIPLFMEAVDNPTFQCLMWI
jgi:hypothetical protein